MHKKFGEPFSVRSMATDDSNAPRFHVVCPFCQTVLDVPQHLAGNLVACGSCARQFQAPLPGAVADPGPLSGFVPARPGKVQAIGAMMLAGGIWAAVSAAIAVFLLFFPCCLWPGTYYEVVIGVLAIVRGASLLGANAHLQRPPKAIAILQIVNIINLDIVNLVLGILNLVFLSEPQVKEYFRG